MLDTDVVLTPKNPNTTSLFPAAFASPLSRHHYHLLHLPRPPLFSLLYCCLRGPHKPRWLHCKLLQLLMQSIIRPFAYYCSLCCYAYFLILFNAKSALFHANIVESTRHQVNSTPLRIKFVCYQANLLLLLGLPLC